MALKRIRTAAARVALAALISIAAAAPASASMRDLAPADEYFGRMKMSVLGIRNELNGLERKVAFERGNAAGLTGRLALVDDAINDWRGHYPRDTWLPRFEQQRARIAAMIGVGTARWVLRR